MRQRNNHVLSFAAVKQYETTASGNGTFARAPNFPVTPCDEIFQWHRVTHGATGNPPCRGTLETRDNFRSQWYSRLEIHFGNCPMQLCSYIEIQMMLLRILDIWKIFDDLWCILPLFFSRKLATFFFDRGAVTKECLISTFTKKYLTSCPRKHYHQRVPRKTAEHRLSRKPA